MTTAESPAPAAPVGDPRCAAPAAETEALRQALAEAPASLAAMFLERVERSGTSEAFRRRNAKREWESFTWTQTSAAVTEIAAGLISLGVQPEDRVAIASNTRLDWILADLGVLCAGAATTTVYPTTSTEDVHHILGDSQSKVVIAEDTSQLAKINACWDDLPDLTHVILIQAGSLIAAGTDERVITLDTLRRQGRQAMAGAPTMVTDRVAGITGDHLATLMYTSGTTGRPKGVRLTHANWVYEGLAIEATDVLREDDLQYLWLPLSHSFGKVLLTVQLRIGFASAVDGDVTALVENLAVIKPTFMAGAPRIFEKVFAKVTAGAHAEGGAKKAIFNRAMATGRKVSRLRLQGKEPSGLLATEYKFADKLVYSKLRDRFGGRIRYFISGSAALSKDIGEWFHAAGITVLEGYGLTETSAGTFINRPSTLQFGTVGPPFAGTAVKLDTDGEVLLKGPGVMDGYHNLPGDTAECFTADGWFRTGDIGEFTGDGLLRITDRKKDLIKTSGGKFVAPQTIESMFKATCPYVSNIVVHGEGRKFVSALITLDPEAAQAWAEQVPELGEGKSYEQIVSSPVAHEMVQEYVDQVNGRLGRWETIKKFEILKADLTVESGDLTPSMKVKRRVVEDKNRALLDSFYKE
jgi:long-chain acyl-CoA synthetase